MMGSWTSWKMTQFSRSLASRFLFLYDLEYGKKGSCKYSKLWACATVKNILNETVYLGIVTQNRTGSRSYKDKTMIQKPEAEWICHEDAHEAIIDRELWETVQEKNRAVKQ